jgi:hypothetical protein
MKVEFKLNLGKLLQILRPGCKVKRIDWCGGWPRIVRIFESEKSLSLLAEFDLIQRNGRR